MLARALSKIKEEPVHPDKPTLVRLETKAFKAWSGAVRGDVALKNTSEAEAMRHAVRHGGRVALMNHLRFYGRFLIPEIAVSVWLFAIFAGMAYAVPNLICSRLAKTVGVCGVASIERRTRANCLTVTLY